MDFLKDINNALESWDSRMRAMETKLASLSQSARLGDSDPYPFTRIFDYLDGDSQISFRLGKITAVLPWVNIYRVALEKHGGEVLAVKSLTSYSFAFGVSDNVVLQPDTDVIVFRHREMRMAVIVGVIPVAANGIALIHSDMIQQGSSTGLKKERSLRDLGIRLAESGSLATYHCGSPEDQTVTDWTHLTSTGAGIHVDEFQTFLRVSEACGLFLNYLDEHTRLAARNLDVHTASSQEVHRRDENELTEEVGKCVFPWEAMGAYAKGSDPFRNVDPVEAQFQTAKAAIEPKFPDIERFCRIQEYGGYLGQGMRKTISAPPDQPPEFRRMSDPAKDVGLFEMGAGLDGAFWLRSAKSITLAKQCSIPIPKRKRIPESPLGDTAEKYSPADHKVKDPTFEDQQTRQQQQQIQIEDALAHLFNWKGLHPFHYHDKDFDVPEEGETEPINANHSKINFDALKNGSHLPLSETVQVKVDDRYGTSLLFKNKSYIAMLDDGGIVIGAGGGEEIRLSGGNIYITAPGDIWLQSGKNVNAWAGRDLNAKAKNSMDLVATDKDFRVKAKGNVQILGGNGGMGGVLIESKAKQAVQVDRDKVGEDVSVGGILLRAPESFVATATRDVYLRTGNQSGEGTPQSGNIYLDAAKGTREVIINCASVTTYAGSIYDYFGTANEDGFKVDSVNYYSADVASISGTVQIDGNLAIQGMTLQEGGIIVNAKGSAGIVIIDGVYLSTKSEQVGKIDRDQIADSVETAMREIEETFEEVESKGEEKYNQFSEAIYADPSGIGSAKFQEFAKFSFRDDSGQLQYGTQGNNWWLPATRWQTQIDVGQATGGQVWEEDPVEFANRKLYPFPGEKKSVNEEVFLTKEELQLVDPETGLAKPRGEEYEEFAFSSLEKKKLDEAYKVVG